MRTTAPPRVLLLGLLVLVAVLTAVSLTLNLVDVSTAGKPFDGFDRLVILFDTGLEANVPTWFSSAVLLVAALLLWGTSQAAAADGSRWTWHWRLLAVAFVYLSVDELSQLHELANPVIDSVLDVGGVLRFGWVLVAAPLVLALAVVYVGFLRVLPRRTAALFVAAGLLYVGGALGVELLGAWVYDTRGPENALYVLVTSVEELCEMLGVSLLVYAVADHQVRAAAGRGSSAAPARRDAALAR